ncbi:MAG TPA: GTP 3',8-cyclase MoaA [Dehalococcoidia bacterium]|nr:GTP 3',8-cyclase MoaA [Dehalococcoidia bacterium]
MTGLSDPFNRPINYLRISVTDRCNLRCIYCLPAQGIDLLPHGEILTYEEIATIARLAAELGINKLRLTGGEPLVRAGLPRLIAMLAEIDAIDDISLTTNGVLLEEYAAELKRAGLKRVNVSLDTLDRDKFQRITRHDRLAAVLRGIEAAKACGLDPVKINMVVMRGMNDDEIPDFARLTVSQGWHVRFIELMPFAVAELVRRDCGGGEVDTPGFMPAADIKQHLSSLGRLEACLPPGGNGPARYYRFPGASGTIGFITPVSEHFCFSCNRLRLTAEGKLRPCLLSDRETDLRQPLRSGASCQELKQVITRAIRSKPQKHRLRRGKVAAKRLMSQVGG